YVDDTTGKTLKTKPLSGKTNAKSGYTTAKDIQTYKDLGYTLVSDSTNGAEIVFDNDDKNDQTFEVHLKHDTVTVTPDKPGKPGTPINPGQGSASYPDGTDKAGLTDTVNRTITYQMSDGSKAPAAVHDSLSYTATKVIDKVTGAVIKTDWSQN
ncbi:mucin-binding protein, partial [Limosilactobacillus allomucosae]|uniref:mucin-binding protein n=1 Tax=Limosilactobacillus allomucosae TaxID=3142938 RepID=UPI00327B9575